MIPDKGAMIHDVVAGGFSSKKATKGDESGECRVRSLETRIMRRGHRWQRLQVKITKGKGRRHSGNSVSSKRRSPLARMVAYPAGARVVKLDPEPELVVKTGSPARSAATFATAEMGRPGDSPQPTA